MQAELVLALDLVGCIFCTSQSSGPLPPMSLWLSVTVKLISLFHNYVVIRLIT